MKGDHFEGFKPRVKAGNLKLSNHGPNLSKLAYPNPVEIINTKVMITYSTIFETLFRHVDMETGIRRKTIISKKER